RGLVDDGAERDAPVDGRVDVLDAEQIAPAEERRRSRRGLVRELELGVAARVRAHRSGDVDPDHLGEARAAAFLFEVKRYGRDLFDRGARVAAGAEAPVAAHEHEAAA